MSINLQVLADSGEMICPLVEPCLFGDTGIETTDLDFLSERFFSDHISSMLSVSEVWKNKMYMFYLSFFSTTLFVMS